MKDLLGATPQRSIEAGSIAPEAASHVASTFTPGPWMLETVRTSVGICHKIGPFPTPGMAREETWACVYEDGMSKQVLHDQGRLKSALFANAHLISAAPEMHEALTKVTPLCDAINELIEDDEDLRARVMALFIKHGLQDDYGYCVHIALMKAEGRSHD